ncbi:MAG: cyclic nucleotide-binding domain-containing protein [Planctomycetia bacterium]|nr:cyclic nucleotide-binding domain-containing protein [Planctomycetia bacterium]
MKKLENYLNKLLNFTDSEIQILLSLFTEKKLKKNEYFAVEGGYSSKIAFIKSGVMRAFYRNNEGDEYNKTFFTNSSFIGAYSSLITGQENLINIQCLTDCVILKANYEGITNLYDSTPKFERLSRILAERFFIMKEKREIELVMLDASERYEIFKKEHPNLENLIPQYHIASYLGITPTQLSRIRAKK